MIELADIPGLLDLSQEALIILRKRQEDDPQLPEISMVNAAFTALLGYTRTELIGRNLRALRGHSVTREAFKAFTRLVTGDGGNEILMPLLAASDIDILVRIRVVTIPARQDLVSLWMRKASPNDEPEGLVATIRSTFSTLQKLSDEQFYIIEITDAFQLRFHWLGQRSGMVLGYRLEELADSAGLAGIVVNEDRILLRQHHQRLIAGEPHEASYRVRLPDRSIRRVTDRAQALRPAEHSLTHHIIGSLATIAPRANDAATPGFIRAGTALAAQLHTLVCLMTESGDLVWASNEPATPLADSIRRAVGRALSHHLSGRRLDDWLGLADQVFTDMAPINTNLEWPADGSTALLSVHATRLDEELALLIVRPADSLARPYSSASQGDGVSDPHALELIDAPACVITGAGVVDDLNKAARDLSARYWNNSLAVGARLQSAVGPSFELIVGGAIEQAKRSGEIVSIDVMSQGGHEHLKLRMRTIPDWSRSKPAKLLVRIDSEENDKPGSLNASRLEAEISTLFEITNDGLLVVDTTGIIRRADARSAAILGMAQEALEGMLLDELLKQMDGTKGAFEALTQRLARESSRSEILFITQAEGLFPVQVWGRPVDYTGGREYILAVKDMRHEKDSEEAIRFFAYYDALTGLPNRRLFLDRLGQAIQHAQYEGTLVGVLLLDLDRFGLINDSLGFAIGDQVLGAIAGRLLGQAGEHETVARLSSDEFALLLPHIDSTEAAAQTAQRLIETIRSALPVADRELSLSASIGLTLYPSDGGDADMLMQKAATACSRAVQQGGNRFQFYAEDMNSTALQRLMLETRLRRALEQGEFVVYYQPIVAGADGRIIGLEALIRWFHPEVGMVSPADFIPLAEETGLIVPIGHWVLQVACRQVRRWQEQFERTDLRLAVNLSARQFELERLPATIRDILDETGFSPGSLELELTESAVMGDAEQAGQRMEDLARLGVRLAIDDFGTGYSSLGYLRRFPIDTLKIDRSFTKEIEHDQESLAIVKAILGLGNNLGLNVVAEGVETKAQLALLRELDCNEVQGYFLCRPLPAEEVMDTLQAEYLPRSKE